MCPRAEPPEPQQEADPLGSCSTRVAAKKTIYITLPSWRRPFAVSPSHDGASLTAHIMYSRDFDFLSARPTSARAVTGPRTIPHKLKYAHLLTQHSLMTRVVSSTPCRRVTTAAVPVSFAHG